MAEKTPGLEGCEAKFARGQTHANALRAEIAEALKSYSYPVRIEKDEKTRQYVFYVESVPESDAGWGLVFGDAIHNFRSTLDHLVVQLAVLGKGQALTDVEMKSAKFPVLSKRDAWSSVAGPNDVHLLRSGERDRIRELQPFNATDQSIWGQHARAERVRGARIPRLIQALHHADIADKHRFIHPSWYAVAGVGLPPIEGIDSTMAHGQRLDADNELGRWGVSEDADWPDIPSDLDISRYFPLSVEFPYGSFALSMLDFIDEIESTVAGIIELFRPAITKGDPTPPVTTLLKLVATD